MATDYYDHHYYHSDGDCDYDSGYDNECCYGY